MSKWAHLIVEDSPAWSGLKGYANERIAALTLVCTTSSYTDAEIRAAQAGIAELHALLALPASIRSAEKHKQTTPRRGY